MFKYIFRMLSSIIIWKIFKILRSHDHGEELVHVALVIVVRQYVDVVELRLHGLMARKHPELCLVILLHVRRDFPLSQKGHCLCSSTAILTAEEACESPHLIPAAQVIREQVSWINFTSHFAKLEGLRASLLLDQEHMGLQVSDLPSPDLAQIPRATLESVHTRTGTSQSRSRSRLWWPSAAPAARTTP